MGLLTPFFLRSWIVGARPGRRLIGLGLLAAAFVPIVVALDRGLWISVGVALAYFAIRRFLAGSLRAIFAVGLLVVVVAVAVIYTPAGGLISARIAASGDSNQSRTSLYGLAFSKSFESPLIGHGAPYRIPGSVLPPVGTHGLIWYLMFVHGFPGLVFFLLWLIGEVVRSARIRAPDDWWPHLCLVIALVQTAFYGLLPQVVLIGVAAGLARRAAPSPSESRRAIHAGAAA